MKAVVQRVTRAKVTTANGTAGEIDRGFLVLLGVAEEDRPSDAISLADKIAGLRAFDDDRGKMNRSLAEVGGRMLVVSQFTLLADCRRGRRPSFDSAARPEAARGLYEAFVAAVRTRGIEVATGCFGENMQVELVNDGPVTLLLDSQSD